MGCGGVGVAVARWRGRGCLGFGKGIWTVVMMR